MPGVPHVTTVVRYLRVGEGVHSVRRLRSFFSVFVGMAYDGAGGWNGSVVPTEVVVARGGASVVADRWADAGAELILSD
jgi:hypothetical protein